MMNNFKPKKKKMFNSQEECSLSERVVHVRTHSKEWMHSQEFVRLNLVYGWR